MPKVTTKLTAGRPSERKAAKTAISMTDDAKDVRLNFLVPAATRDKLKVYCAQNKTTISDLMRQYVDTLSL